MTFRKWFKLLLQPVKRCTVCGRRLTTAVDRARGMGPGCWRKENPVRLPKINKDGGEDL